MDEISFCVAFAESLKMKTQGMPTSQLKYNIKKPTLEDNHSAKISIQLRLERVKTNQKRCIKSEVLGHIGLNDKRETK